MTDDGARWRILTGRETPPPRVRELHAGPVSVLLDGADLRHVRVGGTELVQRVYVAVRDAPWNTIPGELDAWRIDAREDAFTVRFRSRHRYEAIDFRWEGLIEGSPSGEIRYTLDGTCHGAFQFSKIGFNVHHGLPGSVGRRYRARAGARAWSGTLPVAIEPQRIVDGALTGLFEPYEELAIEVADGLEAVVRLDGDLLEMQDHRNWMDGNLKSYATPLALGFPFTSTDAQRIVQTLSISHRGTPPDVAPVPPTLRLGRVTARRMPAIGLAAAGHGEPLTGHERRLLAALAPDHLRVALRMRDDEWRNELARGAEEATSLGAGLELALFVGEGSAPALERLADDLRVTAARVDRVLVYALTDGFSAVSGTTPATTVAMVRRVLEPLVGEVPFAAGTDQSFSDVNRDRPTDPRITGICFAASPTVHAADDASIVENLAGLEAVVGFARRIGGSRSVHVGPVTLATRFGPYPAGPARPGGLPPAVDVRQPSMLAAAWTLGSIAAFARGADSVTYYETTGWQGVVERESGSPMPDRFHSAPGAAFPLYHVLADALELRGGSVRETEASDPLVVTGLAVDVPGATITLVANLTPQHQQLTVAGLSGPDAVVRWLDEESAPGASDDPLGFRSRPGDALDVVDGAVRLEARPYAVARIHAPAR